MIILSQSRVQFQRFLYIYVNITVISISVPLASHTSRSNTVESSYAITHIRYFKVLLWSNIKHIILLLVSLAHKKVHYPFPKTRTNNRFLH